jgi:hypothetical protein
VIRIIKGKKLDIAWAEARELPSPGFFDKFRYGLETVSFIKGRC